MDFVIWLLVHTLEYILMVGAGILLINVFFFKFARYFSYPSTSLVPLMLDL